MLELMHIKGVVWSCLYSNVMAFNVQIYFIRSCALKPNCLGDTCRVEQWQEARGFNKKEITTEKEEEEDTIQSPDHLLSSCLGGQCGRTTHTFTLAPLNLIQEKKKSCLLTPLQRVACTQLRMYGAACVLVC